jgi:hypothetical protein
VIMTSVPRAGRVGGGGVIMGSDVGAGNNTSGEAAQKF